MPGNSEEVAKVAYELWEKEGRPVGRESDNWYEAEAIVDTRMKEASQAIAEEQDAYADSKTQRALSKRR